MKKTLSALILATGFGAYIYWNSRTVAPFVANQASNTVASEPVAAGDGVNTASTSAAVKYKDGTYAGDTASTIYGDVQVAAVIHGGKIDDVKILKYPNDRENSLEISNRSLPILKQEAIAVQSAQVDIVSGATQTVEGFQQSLLSALSKAQA